MTEVMIDEKAGLSHNSIADLIVDYYEARGLKWPTTAEAILWVITELGEACEQVFGMQGDWVRNNPDDHEAPSEERLSEELGDAIMMCIVAGMVRGHDPFQSLLIKLGECTVLAAEDLE